MKILIQTLMMFSLLVIFLSGFIVLLNNGMRNVGMNMDFDEKCPKFLVRNGNKLSLLDSNKQIVLSFYSLDEYEEHLKEQKKRGVHCPVLYVQEENNAQGNDIYKMYSNPFQLESGVFSLPLSSVYESIDPDQKPIPVLDANRDNSPFNANNYPGYDPVGLNVGEYTTIDEVHDSTKNEKYNDNAMDTNWQGVKKTEQSVASGKYIDN
jgi:hypothetical protein